MTKYFKSIPSLTFVLVGLSYLSPLDLVRASEFNCAQTGHCLSSTVSSSEQCLEDQNKKILDSVEETGNIVLLSTHGSSLEQVEGHLSSTLATVDNWNQYDFSDHGSATRVYWICG
ncbi:MAG: hypothetical protein AAF572_11985 [Cyanobacteria bacterium P01_B01_bin.77]